MIYTIKCRRGHCGSQFAYESHNREPGDCEQTLRERAEKQGWVYCHDGTLGWLCPFDAPKEAAKPTTNCSFPGCSNTCRTHAPEVLVACGWHGLHNDANEWLCPACWKTTQPDPAGVGVSARNTWILEDGPAPEPIPIFDQAEAMHAAELSIDEVREIAADAAHAMLDLVITDAERMNLDRSVQGPLGLWESLRLALAMQRPERTNNAERSRDRGAVLEGNNNPGDPNAEFSRGTGSPDDAGVLAQGSGPAEGGNTGCLDGQNARDDDPFRDL